MKVDLNENIIVISDELIVNNKASEIYIDVVMKFQDYEWSGYVPLSYRRTGLNIDIEDKNKIYEYLNSIYEFFDPKKYMEWVETQEKFWKTKPNATVTKSFFDTLKEGGWKCGSCEMPRNANPQRRIQDLKEFGYTIATDTKRFCEHCKRNTSQRILLPLPRFHSEGNGYETIPTKLRAKIISTLKNYDSYEGKPGQHLLPDHKFSEIRWDHETKAENDENMQEDEIKEKFQLLTNQRNQQKREVCRTCFQTDKRGTIYGIKFYYEGNENWDENITKKGKEAEKGCVGCPWYDIEQWRQELLKKLDEKK